MRNLFNYLGSLILVGAMALPNGGTSQETSSEWLKLYNDVLVQISYKQESCNLPERGTNNEYLYLQFQNKSNKPIRISFVKELWYNGKCLTCDKADNEYNFTVHLKGDEIKEGKCGDTSDKAFFIYSKMLDQPSKSVLTNFKLNNVTTIIE